VIQDLSEHTKRGFDVAAFVTSFAALGLSQTAVLVSILAGLLSIMWTGIRIYDRLKYGRAGRD
jgi:hypothetical protein